MRPAKVVTEPGQTSIAAKIRKQLNLKPGQKLRWQKVGDNECRALNDAAHGVKSAQLLQSKDSTPV